jgi:hypothetical protein
MKNMPSIARIERKNKAWGRGELLKAFTAWLRFAPRNSHCFDQLAGLVPWCCGTYSA